MTRRILTLSLLALSACQQPATPCAVDGECVAGARCIDKLCVVSTGGSGGGGTAGGRAGGTAGGSGGGTSGGTSGGGSSGGGTAGGIAGGSGGGTAGGNPALCDGGCAAEWEACIDNGGAGQCEPGVVEVRAPTEGETYAAGTNVTVSATLLTPDAGSPWPTAVMIPFATTWARSGTVQSGMPFVTPGATDGGTGVVTVGWTDGGPAVVTRMVGFTSCTSVMCQPYQRCEATVGGGRCDAQPMTVSWVSPSNNGLVRGPMNGSFNPVVQVQATDAGVVFPPSVPVTFDGGVWALTRMGATEPAQYGGVTVTMTAGLAGADGPKTFIAGWPMSGVAALSANQTVTWDSTGPRFAVRVQPVPIPRPSPAWGNPTVWRKDERMQVEVGSIEPLSGQAGLTANLSTAGVTTRAAGARCPAVGTGSCPESRCDCFEVDLAAQTLISVSGFVSLQASGQDVVGNAGQDAGPVVPVTRVKWQAAPTGGAAVGVVEPALDRLGNVYVGYTRVADASGVVKQLNSDGAEVWANVNYGAVTAPVVWSPTANPDGGPGLFVATRVTLPLPSSEIRAIEATTGAQVGNTGTCFNAVTTYTARMLSLGSTVVTAREGVGQQQAFLADPAGGSCIGNGSVLVTGKPTVVGRGGFGATADVYIASTGNPGFNKLTTNGTNTNWVGMALSLSGSQLTSGVALGPTRGFLTVSGANTQGVVANNLDTSSPSSQTAFTSGSPASLVWTTASLGVPDAGAYDVFIGTSATTVSGDLYKTHFTPGMPVGTFSPNDQMPARFGPFDAANSTFTPAHQPILGGGGTLFVVSTQGDLVIFNPATRLWGAPAATTTFGPVSVSPALDVSRTSTGAPQCGRPGILYVLSNTGTVTAFIVDSPGLERGAAWPRFQHDNANSGNADMSNDAWSCP